MQLAHVDIKKCDGHEKCHARKECPTKALIQLDPGETVIVSGDLCHGCGDCIAACPHHAIELKQV